MSAKSKYPAPPMKWSVIVFGTGTASAFLFTAAIANFWGRCDIGSSGPAGAALVFLYAPVVLVISTLVGKVVLTRSVRKRSFIASAAIAAAVQLGVALALVAIEVARDSDYPTSEEAEWWCPNRSNENARPLGKSQSSLQPSLTHSTEPARKAAQAGEFRR